MFAGEFAFLHAGLQYITASRALVFFGTAPFVVAIGMHLPVPSERLVRLQVIGLFVGIVAALGETLALPSRDQWIGDLMPFGAAALWGGTTVLVRATSLSHIAADKTLFYQLVVSGEALPLASPLIGEPGFTDLTAIAWASLARQTVGVAFASYLAWFHLVTRCPATRLSAFSFLAPLFGMVFGAVLLGERITPGLGLAMVLVAVGIRLVNRS